MQTEKVDLQVRDEGVTPSSELVANAAKQARDMLSADVPGNKILTMIAHTAESISGEHSVCSILALDGDGLLRNAASPNLPADYLAAIDRLKPNPRVGTCSAAAATGLVVVTEDFRADDKWPNCAICLCLWVLPGHGACQLKLRMEKYWGP